MNTPQSANDTKAPRKIVQLWLHLAKQGHAKAQYTLGRMYAEGKGTRRDYQKAHVWLFKSAQQGYANAQMYLGIFYTKNIVTPKNDAKAAYWLRSASEQGMVKAQCYLSRMYASGKGVPKSFVYAYMWAMLAATGGKRIDDADEVEIQKFRSYALNILESFASQMTKDEASAAIRMAKKWRIRQQKTNKFG